MRLSLLFLTLGALWAQDPIASRDALNEGVQAFRAARYPEAVQSFQRAVELDPSSAVARLYLGTAYFQQYIPGADSPENRQNAARAGEEFQQVLALDPQNKVALASLASLELNQKHWGEARAWYERLITVDPNNADAYYSLGFIAWSEWYPSYRDARTRLGMRPEAPGPIPDPVMRQDLQSRFAPLLAAGIANLQKALELNQLNDDAMAYMNLLIRERADLRDTADEWRRDTTEADQWVQKALETKRLKAQQAPPSAASIRVGDSIQATKLVSQVRPVYPPLAKQAGIQGVVRLNVTVSKEGRIINISVISGHPLLVPAALEAVKQWVYEPTLLNGDPVEVRTEIDVPFSLNQ